MSDMYIPCLMPVSEGDLVRVLVQDGHPVAVGCDGGGDRMSVAIGEADAKAGSAQSAADAADAKADEAKADAAKAAVVAAEANQAAAEAEALAAATSQHFFADDSGIHVAEEEGNAAAGHNILINALGMLIRRGAAALVSITESAVAFFDGAGNGEANQTAMFGRSSARIGRLSEGYTRITPTGVVVYSPSKASGTLFADEAPVLQPVGDTAVSGGSWSGHASASAGAALYSLPAGKVLEAGACYRVAIAFSGVTGADGAEVAGVFPFGIAVGDTGMEGCGGSVVRAVADEEGTAVFTVFAAEDATALHLCLGEGHGEDDAYYPGGTVSSVSVDIAAGAPVEVMSAGSDGISFGGSIVQRGQNFVRSAAGNIREYSVRTDVDARRGRAPSGRAYIDGRYMRDRNGDNVGYQQVTVDDGEVLHTVAAQSKDAAGGNALVNRLALGIDAQGKRTVHVSEQAPWRAAIGAAAASHNHSAASITSGTLPIARGGTGAATKAAAFKALGAWTKVAEVTGTNSATVSLSGYYEVLVMAWYSTSYMGSACFLASNFTATAKEIYLGGGYDSGGSRRCCCSLSSTAFAGVRTTTDGTARTATYRLYAR